MLTAKDIMTKEVITLAPNLEISQAAARLLEKRINGAPVVDNAGNLIGILCQSDLIATQKKLSIPSLFTLLDGFFPFKTMKHMETELEKIAAITVEKAMTRNPKTISPSTPVEEIATLMVEKSHHTLPVVESGRLVGIVGKEDVLRTLSAS